VFTVVHGVTSVLAVTLYTIVFVSHTFNVTPENASTQVLFTQPVPVELSVDQTGVVIIVNPVNELGIS
jgi:hypothetical protein